MWWYLLLILPALIILMLFMPVYLSVKLDNTTPQFKVKLGFINITRFLIKEDESESSEKNKCKKKKGSANAARNPKQEGKKKLSLGEKIELFKETVSIAWSAVKAIAKRITVTRFSLDCRVSTDDAAQTAILYGTACAAVSALLAFVNENLKVKKQDISVYPDFTQQKSYVYADLRIRIFVFSIIGAGISVLFNLVKRKAD